MLKDLLKVGATKHYWKCTGVTGCSSCFAVSVAVKPVSEAVFTLGQVHVLSFIIPWHVSSNGILFLPEVLVESDV